MRSLAAVIGLLTGLGVLSAQVNVFYRRDFNSGVPPDWSLNTGDLGSTTTGLYNEWIVGADYNNPPPSFEVPIGLPPFIPCGSSCLPITINSNAIIPPQPAAIQGAPNSAFLHVSYIPSNSTAGGCTAPATRTTSFLAADGFCYSAQRYFARMNTAVSIPAGTAPVKLSFFWVCNGNSNGYGEVYYSTNGGNTWNILTSSVTNTQRLVDRSAQWNADTITLPITRPANVLIGFRFVNNANADEDPPLAVDDIAIFEEVPQTGPTIDITSITPAQVCAGSTVSVAFSTSGTFNAGNQFEAQLSDASGSFAVPIATARGAGSPITLTVPAGTATGTYKVRVVSTSPAVISNTVDLQVVNLSNLTCTATPNPGSPGTPVTLTISGSGLPAGPFDVSLNPGDGSPSQTQNGVAGLPVNFNHTYASAGSYTATFTVTHPASGCSQTCPVTVQVAAPGSPTITLQPPVPWVCNGDGFTVSFTTSGTFGANNTFSVQLSDATGSFANPTVIGSGNGTPIACVIPATTPSGDYKIRVVASDPAGIVSNEQPISVANLSGLSCSVSPVPVPAGQTATFTVGGNGLPAGSYNITFTPGNGDPNQDLTDQTLPATLTYTYNADGQYTAQIQVVHTPSNCVKTCDVTVFVGQQALTLTALQPTAACAGETFTATYQGTNITFDTGNLFILEITDGGGNVVSRCTTSSTAEQGTLSCAVPASLAGGSYTVRLVSTNPPFQSGTQPLTVLSKPWRPLRPPTPFSTSLLRMW
jgi:hypothetical protein